MNNLTRALRNTYLSDRPEELEQLQFRPQAGSGLSQTALDEIPRYLFRVVSPHSVGETNKTWVRSESALRNERSSMEDIFLNLDTVKRTTIARTLNLHLRWWPKGELRDNFVSWTSSLLFAIQYIYYRHLSPEDESSLEQIKLYIIDTTRLQYLRNETIQYFGEYLSQGSLKIEGKCEMISAQSFFESDRLRRLQPHFLEFHDVPFSNGKPIWVKEVIRLHETIWPFTDLPILSSAEMADRLEAVKEIIQNLTPSWRYPLAIYLTALIGSISIIEDKGAAIDNIFLSCFQSVFPHGGRQQGFRPSSFNIVAPETMPEMKQVKRLVREIQKYCALRQALDHVKVAEASIRNLHFDNVTSEDGRAFVVADPNELLDRTGQTLLSRLRSVQMLCEEVTSAISLNSA
ncbi:hypothetical protein BDV29DRAFT_196174 [Aspergillus leporis]|uniref:DUF7587 domain-containing protein n=1 Tax=Aspergillus leporis TaxID=41062 RepID=A0A5N5WH70_9EURO|nr:hypothetical protein BDV29DRAFT_196174 [Aspergillus leporis]